MEDLTESCCKKVVDDCNAKCFLDEQVNEESKEDQKGTEVQLKLKLSEFEIEYFNNIFPEENSNKFFPSDISLHKQDFVHHIDHPPRS